MIPRPDPNEPRTEAHSDPYQTHIESRTPCPKPLRIATRQAHSFPMTDEGKHLSGDDLEQFFRDHGGRRVFERYQEALKVSGARVDAWDDGWRLSEGKLGTDIQVYRHSGRML